MHAMNEGTLEDWPARVAALATTAEAVALVVVRIPNDDAPGLGEWTCAQLAHHASRAMSTLRTYAARAAPTSPELDDAPGYVLAYLAERESDPDAIDRAIARRTTDGASLRTVTDIAAGLRADADWARSELAALDPGWCVPTRFGAMQLGEYLRTRSMELVVHGFDLESATGVGFEPPERAIIETLELLGAIAVRSGNGPGVIRALTGRVGAVGPVLR